ncbi:SCL-interrupting locus protein homolog [Lytechinus pictus]|uniref:SCL-interrupting locus protein homolog n=1 Tax=Lytechinus pictus TaxID=7653 RepID=UPI0030BA034E
MMMESVQGPHPRSSYFPPPPSKHPSSNKQKPAIKQNVFKFPLTKNILWDQTPIGSSINLHPMHRRNISLCVSEAAVRLAHRHALQATSQPYHGFLVGTITVDPDEEGLTMSLDRFDPGRDVPGRNTRLPTAKLPADFVVPLTTFLGDADISATHTSDDFIAAFKLLESSLTIHGSVDPAKYLTLRALCRCHSNTDDITLGLHFGAVSVSTSFTGCPVKSIPIIPTALARNLMGPLSLSDVQGSYKTGFLSMDETRKLLLLLESDPKASTIPLVGIWLSGITQMSNPVVWSACLRYLHSNGIHERVSSPNGGFLVVMFTCTSRHPLFYECMVKSDQEPRFMLVGCRENLHVFKHARAKGKPPVEMELTPARSGPSKSLFMQSLSRLTHKHRRSSNSRRRSTAADSMSTEESHLMPRPSPKPILDKSPSVMPSVPELSFISDSFCDPTDHTTTNQVSANVHPKQQPDHHPVQRQRLGGQSEDSRMTRLHGTSKTPLSGQHPPGMKGTDQTKRQNRPGPLRPLNGQELENARNKAGHSAETQNAVKRTNQMKSKVQSSGYGLHQRHTNRPNKGRPSVSHGGQDRSSVRSLQQQSSKKPVQQPKSSEDEVERNVQPSSNQPLQQSGDVHLVGTDIVLQTHQPDTHNRYHHSPVNVQHAEAHGYSNIPSEGYNTLPEYIPSEGEFYADASNHQQGGVTTGFPSECSPKTTSIQGHPHPMATADEGLVQSPSHDQTRHIEGVTAGNVKDNKARSDAGTMGGTSKELSGMDIRTMEQLKRQEEMIQQLQEQIKLLLQAHIPQPPTPSPLGLLAPPATSQGAHNLYMQESPGHNVPPGTGPLHSNPGINPQSPSLGLSSPKGLHVRGTACAAPASPVSTRTATTSTGFPLPSPVMCSMAVNTGQSLFCSAPLVSEFPGSPPVESDPKDTRHPSIPTPGSAAMPAPESTSTPVGTQSDDVKGLHSNTLHQTERVVEMVDSISISSCPEPSQTSSRSPRSSEPHTPRQSPDRSQDESAHIYGANLSSPTLGESASTYAPPRPQVSDEESSDSDEEEDEKRDTEEEKGVNMASPSLLYRDEKRFYDNLLGQVQELLHSDSTDQPPTPDPVPSDEPDLPRALPDISMATLDELQKLGINLHSTDITITDRSLYRSLYNVSPDLHPQINYVSLADFTFDPSDLSMEANAIAMKYLSDGELAKMSAGFQGDRTPGKRGGVNPLLRSVLTGIREDGGASGRGGDVDSSIGVNMSLASRKYMEKYGLMSGCEAAVSCADSSSPRGVGHLAKPSPVRFMKSPAVARTYSPKEGTIEIKRGLQSKPTKLSYNPTPPKDIITDQSEGINTPRTGKVTSDSKPTNVLGQLRKGDKEPCMPLTGDEKDKGNILDISKLKQLPKLL